MTELPVLVDLDSSNLESMPCCGVKKPAHEGRQHKICWLRDYCAKGLRAKVLVGAGNRQCGYIEYLPGEFAWRGVDASGWMFIHCVWTFYRQHQHKRLAAQMIEACVRDASAAGMNGVAVLARESPWLAGSAVYLANGFEVVAEAPPDYQLLVKPLKKRAVAPAFRPRDDRQVKKFGKGLTIVRSDQCPHVAKFAGEIAEAAESEYGLTPRIVELKSHREAQTAPTPYAVFSILYDGRLLTDHQISRTRFRNIMRKVMA